MTARNTNTATADCSGLAFSMPRTEDGTTVTTYLDGRLVRTDTVTTFGAPVAFTIPSPDQTVPHTWAVVVDATWSADQTIVRTVQACTAPTSSTTSAVPPPPLTVVPTTTVVVQVPPPPVPTTTVVTTPRPSVPTTFQLPETGGTPGVAAVGLVFVCCGAVLLRARRVKGVR